MTSSTLRTLAIAGAATAMIGGSASSAFASELPDPVVWTAFQTGSAGYSQAIAIASALSQQDGINMRVLPGRTEIARLAPVRAGQAHFAATGSDYAFAQEGLFAFANRAWGPQPVRLVATGVPAGAMVSLATAADAGITTIADVRGKRVAWVVGSPALQMAVESQLAFADLTWDDVIRVEVSGFAESITGIAEGRLDAAQSTSFSAVLEQLAASPRGLHHPPLPHDDTEGWMRLQSVIPWYFPQVARVGPAIPEGGLELGGALYPAIITFEDRDAGMITAMLDAMYRNFEHFSDAAPGAAGLALDMQPMAEMFVPYHEGTIAYLQSVGLWGEQEQARHEENLHRQEILLGAWLDFLADAPDNDEAFAAEWMAHRAAVLRDADLPVIIE